jgi:hypothetical protein
MPLTTLEKIRNEGNLPGDLPEIKLTPHLEGAEVRLRSLLGEDLYDEVLVESANEQRKKNLIRAESMIALSFAIPVLNIRAGPKGGFVRSTGFGDGRNDFVSYDDANKLADHFYKSAIDLVSKYVEIDEYSDIIEGGSIDWIAV